MIGFNETRDVNLKLKVDWKAERVATCLWVLRYVPYLKRDTALPQYCLRSTSTSELNLSCDIPDECCKHVIVIIITSNDIYIFNVLRIKKS